MSAQDASPAAGATLDALNAVADTLQEGRSDEIADLLNLAVNLTGYLAGHPSELAAFRAGGADREAVVTRALEEAYGQVHGWLAELVAPFAPGAGAGERPA